MKEKIANTMAFIAMMTAHMAVWRALRYNGIDIIYAYFMACAIMYPLMRFIFQTQYKEGDK